MRALWAVGVAGSSLLVGGLLLATQREGLVASPGPAPCASPFSGVESGQLVSFPTNGGTRRVVTHVGENLVVGWSRCGETGRWTSTDAIDETGHLSAYASSGFGGRGSPDNRFRLIGYRAREVGVVELVGRGDKGSHGTLVIRVLAGADGVKAEPIPTPQSRLKETDRRKPRATSCPPVKGPVATLVLGTSVVPACTAVTPLQRLRVVNSTTRDAVVTYGRYPPRTIRAGVTYTFNLQFGYQLSCGVHDIPVSGYDARPEIWVYVC